MNYRKYAEDVVSGKIVSGHLIKLACQRYLDRLDGKEPDIIFCPEKVDRVINFVGHLKHSTDRHAGQFFKMLPWQIWICANLFGFYYKSDPTKRVTRTAYIQIGRKNGKTSLISALGLYFLTNEGQGQEIDIVAPSSAQSAIGFKSASEYAGTINRGNIFKTLRTTIKFKAKNSFLKIMSSSSKFGDGFNTSLGILDEYHAFDNNDISNLLTSSMAMRQNPMMIYITTAGFNLFSPCKIFRDVCADILYKKKEDESIFAAIYEVDAEDEPLEDSSCWQKAIPSLGQTVYKDYVAGEIRKAKNNPSTITNVLTKIFDVWVQAKDVWIPDKYILESMHKVDISEVHYPDEVIYAGVDLASVEDLCSASALIPPNPSRMFYPDKFILKTRCYIPEDSIETTTNQEIYKEAIRNGWLIATPGNVCDYDYITQDLLRLNDVCPIYRIAYDQWNSSQWAIQCEQEGLPISPQSQSIGAMSKAVKTYQRLMLSGQLIIDDNNLVRWSHGNVEIKYDHNENEKPIKAGGKRTAKIDPVISSIMAVGAWLSVGGHDYSVT